MADKEGYILISANITNTNPSITDPLSSAAGWIELLMSPNSQCSKLIAGDHSFLFSQRLRQLPNSSG